MSTYDGVSSEQWLDGLTQMDEMNARHLLVLFGYLGIPESYMDIGCGTGIMVKTAAKLGVRAYGIDQLVEPEWGKNFFHHNLVDTFNFPHEPVDILTCFEVGEHLDPSAHATFCDTLCNSIKPGVGHYLVFSAARPGQGGTGHVACRPAEYWHNEMILRGMHYDGLATMNLALLFSNMRSSLNYLWDNLIVFQR